MKKINLLLISSMAALALVACQKEEPIPDNGSYNGQDNNQGYTNDSGSSFWDQNTGSNNGGSSFWDQDTQTGNGSYADNGLPSEYLNEIVGHQWARAFDGYSCDDFIIDFDIEGYWKAFAYIDGNWITQEEGFVSYSLDEGKYVLFTQDERRYETLLYSGGALQSDGYSFYADAQTPATAAQYADYDPGYTNEDMNIYYSKFDGEWFVIDPNSDTQSDAYYNISNGVWDYFYYDVTGWTIGMSGYLELLDGRNDYVSFYTADGAWLVDAFEFDEGILKFDDGTGTTLERY